MAIIDKKNRFVEGAIADELMHRFGSPLFVVSEDAIKKKYKDLEQALTKHYRPFKIGYSFKTNNLPAICTILKTEGALAEVVSSFEYWLAKKLGYRGEEIIFNGPHKTDDDLNTAISDRCILNIDNRDELHRLIRIASHRGIQPRIGLRVNINEGRTSDVAWDRFGFNIENGEARELCEEITHRRYPLHISGLHMHLGTNIADAGLYRHAAKKLVTFASECEGILSAKMTYLDFGGGFAVTGNRLRGSPEADISSVEDYAASITGTLRGRKNQPLLILEPGRWLIAESIVLLTTVVSVKDLAGISAVTTDASISILREAAYLDFKIEALKNEPGVHSSRIYGCTCTPSDILGHALLPRLTRGDILAFYNVGAYSIPRSSQWISPRPAIIGIDEAGKIRTLRRAETNEDLIRLDLP